MEILFLNVSANVVSLPEIGLESEQVNMPIELLVGRRPPSIAMQFGETAQP